VFNENKPQYHHLSDRLISSECNSTNKTTQTDNEFLLFPHYLQDRSMDCSLGTNSENYLSVNCSCVVLIFTSDGTLLRPDLIWEPPSLLPNGYRGLFPWSKAAGSWSWPL